MRLPSAPVLSHRVFSVHCSTTPVSLARVADHFYQVDSIRLYLYCIALITFNSTMETSVRATELWEPTLHQPLSWNEIAAIILLGTSFDGEFKIKDDPQHLMLVWHWVVLEVLPVMGIIMRNGCTYRANTTAVHQWIYAYSCLADGGATFCLFFSTPWLLFLGIRINLSSFRIMLWLWCESRDADKGSKCVYVSMCVFLPNKVRERKEVRRKKRKREIVERMAGGKGRGDSLGFSPCHRKSVWPVTKCQPNEDGSGGRA